MSLLHAAAAVIILTAIVHSVLGEQRLIGPVLAMDTGVVAHPLARSVLRFAWHFTSVLMVLTALLLIWPGTPKELMGVTGATYVIVGLVDAVATRGRHVGWPLLTGAGVCTLIGA